jgi:hypothetical protein
LNLLVFQGHKGPITGLASIKVDDGPWLLVSSAADEAVLVRESDATTGLQFLQSFVEKQRINVGFEIQNCVAITQLSKKRGYALLLCFSMFG